MAQNDKQRQHAQWRELMAITALLTTLENRLPGDDFEIERDMITGIRRICGRMALGIADEVAKAAE